MPIEAFHPLVLSYIDAFKNNNLDFKTLKRPIKTMYNNTVIETEDENPVNSEVGYIWKEIIVDPIIIGVTKGVMSSNHDAHYHPNDECYYVLEGQAHTLIGDQFVELKKR